MTKERPGTIAGLLRARADDLRPALRAGDHTWSWAEVVDAAAARAAWLTAHRRSGPFHVGVLLDNVPEYCFWLAGAGLAGATVVGINPTHRGAELERDITHTDCQYLLTDTGHLDLVPPGAGVEAFEVDALAAELAPAPLPAEDPAPDALFVLLFTSGTTAAPKAVKCSQGRMVRVASAVVDMLDLTAEDTGYLVMPLFHGTALMTLWTPLLITGGTVALRPRFSASGFLPDVRRHGATYFTYVGKALTYILATPETARDGDNPLRVAFGNEAPAPDIDRFATRFGCRVVEGYGSTEGGTAINRTADTPPGALGRGLPGTVVLNPESGEECAVAAFDGSGRLLNGDDAIGEIANTQGVSRFEGYWRNDDAEHARTRDGIYWTGDLGYRDADGIFYFAGRSDDWLRVDGENFAAAPVERILERHPDVVIAAVYAVPDPLAGDAVMAALQLRPGVAFDPDGFATFLAGQADLGTKWAPRFVRIVATMPLTDTNKVLKRPLRRDGVGGADQVWHRPPRETGYRVLTAEDAESLSR